VRTLAGLCAILLCVLPPAASAREPLPATGTMEVAFTPWDDAEGAIIRAVQGARHTIYVQAYLFTSRALAKALIEAKLRGVKVEVLADSEMATKDPNNNRSQIPQLAAAGIPVRLETRYAIAHNKILLIDAEADASSAVITGSYNFTFSAQARNAENILILRGNPALAKAYLENWWRHHAEAQEYRLQ